MSESEISKIENIINLYPVAVDSQQWNLFDLVFTSDVRADFGGQAVCVGLAPLKLAFEAILAPFETTQHSTCSHHVRIDGKLASCLSYVHGRFIREVASGQNRFESAGWYDDALVKKRTTDGGFKAGLAERFGGVATQRFLKRLQG